MLSRYLLFLLFLPWGILSCSSVIDGQKTFERQAYREPNGITVTNQAGKVQSQDSDDWQISPYFSGLVQVEPAFPNPTFATGTMNIHVTVNAINAINGLMVGVYDPAYESRIIWSVYDSPLPPGLQVIQFNTMLLGRFNTIESARGLHRIILFDSNQNVVSYGDILIE